MNKTHITKCCICGKEEIREYGTQPHEFMEVKIINFYNDCAIHGGTVDICFECKAELEKLVNGLKKKKSENSKEK